MHKLTIIKEAVFLDEKQILGITELDLHIVSNDAPTVRLVLTLDPELTLNQSCDDA